MKDGRDTSTGILFGAMCCLGISAGLRSGELRAVTFEQILRHPLPSGEMLYGLIVDRALNDKGEFVGLKKSLKDDPRERAVILSEKNNTDSPYVYQLDQREPRPSFPTQGKSDMKGNPRAALGGRAQTGRHIGRWAPADAACDEVYLQYPDEDAPALSDLERGNRTPFRGHDHAL